MKILKRLTIGVLALWCSVCFFQGVAAAQFANYYGVTKDGALYSVTITGQGINYNTDNFSLYHYYERSSCSLPTSYLNFQALASVNNDLYAAYDNGKILKFKPDCTGATYVGNSGQDIRGLAYNGSNKLYAAYGTTTIYIAEVNLATGAL